MIVINERMMFMKKLFILLFLFVISFGFVGNVFAADAQGCVDIVAIDAKIPNAIHIIILVLQIVIPVLLVLFGTIDFLRAVTASKDDEIKKGQKTFVSRLIAAVIVFFIVAFVRLIIDFAAGDEAADIIKCADCFINGVNTATGQCK